MRIRNATDYECKKILTYASTVIKESTMGFVKEDISASLQMMPKILADGGYYLVYMDDQMIVGWVGVGQSYNYFTDEVEGLIPELYVLPKYRKQGIAHALLEHAFARLKEAHFKKVQLNVFSGNPAKYLYEKLGFHDVSTLMEKEL
ncbi:GNAT family N-acetyltransferase [Virgibacillus soli]|uniref:GNAT family N-acetyltransferase n=1 Tax=Paracerasibacillus soli TaxID=480284 RepID=A0ABU5CP29_9BACI|nr:GNAT family N-acetyltransferase [Virgibacillus soli]MDY0407564.1 GNAT family N-acetyltransferase [Virgibacillus soli]